MRDTTLVIMAAGIGSRFGGGIKQLEPVGPGGEIIMDYSIYDALKAGFNKIVFIIRRDLEKDFKEIIGNRIEKIARVEYAFQELDDLPDGFTKPTDRKKPWGTGQAVLSIKGLVDGPFLVINADDYYGKQAFREMYRQLTSSADKDTYQYAMEGYHLNNTMTDNGYVARGVCSTDGHGRLVDIHERTHIEKRGEDGAYTEDGGATWVTLPGNSIVSMNLWGFTKSILEELDNRFASFLQRELPGNPQKCEYFLPFVVDELLKEGKAEVTVLESRDRWYGVTYKEDKETVIQAIRHLKDQGLYPETLWEVRHE